MPVVTKEQALEQLTNEVQEKLAIDELLEVYNEIFPDDPYTEAEAREDVTPLIEQLVEKGWVGEKAGQGFYKREKSAAGQSEILTLDPKTLTYRPKQPARLGSIEAAKAIDD